MDNNKTKFSLSLLNINDGEDIYQMLQDLPKEEEGFRNMFNSLNFDEYKQELIKREKESHDDNLVEGRVPQSIYWFYVDGKPAGMVKIRHYLNDSLRQNGGHIGYALAPEYRGKGYGNKILELALLEARNLGVDDILLVCNLDNAASKAVIIKNGGKLERETDKDSLFWIRKEGN